ncbi:class IV adenylate cyclase [Enterovibrio coralii]|uniref:Adenylate cyclase n=1 Tax=Enterovibrio coralii TaxID=294935 RepID=A0A135I551_9GAMM|nr:class IV adenylate cyclase [Enterovibrio coralii]KXF80568.1 adenylate cyclase [Enterovibrio coralii]
MIYEHFKGKFEVELKFRLTSKDAFLAHLKSIPHEVMLEDNTECDWYFDTSDRVLKSQGKSVCIRTMEPSGIKLWIVKGPETDRCEATNITNADNAKSMLQTMGYEVSLKAQKTRSIYFVGKFHITVDALEGIGDFAEFAIMTDDESLLDAYKSELESLAADFGLAAEHREFRSYRDMYA